MSQAWSVYVELAARDVADSVIEDLCERLADCEPAVGMAPNGNLSARVWVETGTARQAIDIALKEITAAAKAAGAGQKVIGVELVSEEELDLRNAEPIVPELAGISEIAEMFDVGRQRAAQLAKRDDFPPPVAQLKAGPVFLASQVRGFEARWDRHGGRPIKPVALSAPEKELLGYLKAASATSSSDPVRALLPDRSQEAHTAELTVSHHEGHVRAVYDSRLHTVSESIRTLRRERLVSIEDMRETPGEETVVDLELTSKGERVAAMS
ncbi:hypothetical protein [Streptomyces sp. f51]|uniref:hypothetical protein n=1 Tax=Streptomyces sp. f51 TaxID=1827742 RepID=UPI000BF0B2CE|nr:hypothetical protein [Streptomyces sp. f51]